CGRIQALRRDGGPRGARHEVQVRTAEVEAGRHDPRLVLRDQGRILSNGPGFGHGRPARATSTRSVSTTPPEALLPPPYRLATKDGAPPSSPPTMQAKQPRSASMVCSPSPPGATRTHRCCGTLAYQIAPSASA